MNLNRHEKLKKLGAAIREYRGTYVSKTGKWKTPPNPAALARVTKWLAAIGQDEAAITASVAAIDGFRHLKEFQTWIQRQ